MKNSQLYGTVLFALIAWFLLPGCEDPLMNMGSDIVDPTGTGNDDDNENDSAHNDDEWNDSDNRDNFNETDHLDDRFDSEDEWPDTGHMEPREITEADETTHP